MKNVQYELSNSIATLTFDEPDSPVNTMCLQWQADLTEATAQVVKDKDAISGIILASNKTTFFAGADLKGLMRNKATDAGAIFTEIERMKKNFRLLETLGKPVVSCLNGAALGGGWEVALVGHYRVAVDDKKIQFGMPEVSLGLIPGASGITKTTRLLGLMGAQPYLLEGKLFNPREGLDLGLIHELVADAAALRPAALAWIAGNPISAQPWDTKLDGKDYKIPGGTPANPKIAMALTVAPAMMKKTTRGLYPAPEAALAAMVEGAQVDFDTALRIESRYLARLAVDTVAKNMINTFFFDMNAVKSRLRKLKEANPGSTPTLTDGISAEALKRISGAYQSEGVRMLGEGMPIAVLNNASFQCGMTAPLNLPEQGAEEANKIDAAWNIQDIKDRLLYRQAVETARCLNEGMLTTVHDANIGSIFGIGFPAYTGGAMQFIYGMGVDTFVQRSAELAAKFGDGFVVTDAVLKTIRAFQPVY